MSVLGKLVVARALDGAMHKGRTADFKPGCASFHVRREDGTQVSVDTAGLKAVFFVKDLEGDPAHREKKRFDRKNRAEKPIWVEFKDGEELAGWSAAVAGKHGFYFTPTDPDSNLERVYVVRTAIKRILQGPQAEQAAQKGGSPTGPAAPAKPVDRPGQPQRSRTSLDAGPTGPGRVFEIE
jgi:hypothetical protein